MTEQQQQELDVETSFGKIRTKGYRLADLVAFIAAVCLVLLVYMAYETRKEAKEAVQVLSLTAKMEHDSLASAVAKGAEAQAEMNYILTLTPEERNKLRLSMPESMRRKLRNGDL